MNHLVKLVNICLNSYFKCFKDNIVGGMEMM